MDTAEKYRDDEFFVRMAGERGPDWYVKRMESNENTVSISPAREYHIHGEQPPVDGWVTFYAPAKLEAGEPFKHGTFPFRDYRSTDALWFANPDAQRGQKSPIWKWQNPGADPHESLTLSPSIGMGTPTDFHCFIRDGEIEWV